MQQHADRRSRGLFCLLTIALVIIGAAARVAPLFDQDGRLLKQCPTEDGYLMLTIARNIALGLGMSTSAGTIPTNGTQPLSTLLYAGWFWLAHGDKRTGVLLVLIFQVFVSGLAAFLLYRVARRLLSETQFGGRIAALTATLWFAGPLTVSHSSNCLESGIYALLVIASTGFYAQMMTHNEHAPKLGRCLVLGALLGLTFLARNDACWLILAFCLVHTLWGAWESGAVFRRVIETFVMGAVSVAVAMPWLVSNLLRFGSIMPISGQAESALAVFGQNLVKLPADLAEHVSVVLLLPASIEGRPLGIAASLVIIAAGLIVYAVLWRRASDIAKRVTLIAALFGLFLAGFYGLFFGAGHFVSRYLFPVSPFLTLAWAVAAWHVCRWLSARRLGGVTIVLATALVLVTLGLDARIYRHGSQHMHFQVVEWVRDNVKDDEWVGAVQSGTCGFFHDRTINLDGKVNPYALKARIARRIPEYVAQSQIKYLVDWYGLAREWSQFRPISDNFDLIVQDPDRNLAVFRRKS